MQLPRIKKLRFFRRATRLLEPFNLHSPFPILYTLLPILSHPFPLAIST
jgi:hypothetical protein